MNAVCQSPKQRLLCEPAEIAQAMRLGDLLVIELCILCEQITPTAQQVQKKTRGELWWAFPVVSIGAATRYT